MFFYVVVVVVVDNFKVLQRQNALCRWILR